MLVSHYPPRVPSILSCLGSGRPHYVPDLQWLADFAVRYLALVNASTNFPIYCLLGPQFRRALAATFGRGAPPAPPAPPPTLHLALTSPPLSNVCTSPALLSSSSALHFGGTTPPPSHLTCTSLLLAASSLELLPPQGQVETVVELHQGAKHLGSK